MLSSGVSLAKGRRVTDSTTFCEFIISAFFCDNLTDAVNG